jgi:hypothetical protein
MRLRFAWYWRIVEMTFHLIKVRVSYANALTCQAS